MNALIRSRGLHYLDGINTELTPAFEGWAGISDAIRKHYMLAVTRPQRVVKIIFLTFTHLISFVLKMRLSRISNMQG